MAIGIDGPLAGDAALQAFVASALDPGLVVGRGAGRPADLIDQAARAGLAVEDGGRPLQDVDAIEQEGIDRRQREGLAPGQLQPIEEIDDPGRGAEAAEAAQEEAVVSAGGVGRGQHAGRIVERILDALRVLVVELLARDRRDRLRGFEDGRVGLGRGRRVPFEILVPCRTPRSLGFHLDRRKRNGRLLGMTCHWAQHCGCREQRRARPLREYPRHSFEPFPFVRLRSGCSSIIANAYHSRIPASL